MWYSVHPEGFSAQIQIAAIAANAGLLDRANLQYPIHAEYFYLSRAGVVLALQALMNLLRRSDDLVFRALMLISFVVLVIASLSFARRRTGLSVWWPGAALLLTPGIAELPFAFNDNIVSAAFAVWGLAVMPEANARQSSIRRITWTLRFATAGALLGFAIVCRPDALLLLPIAAALCWLDCKTYQRAIALVLLVIGLLASLAVSTALDGSSVLQAVKISRFFETLHVNGGNRYELTWTVLLFFGLPQLVLIPIGAALEWRSIDPTTMQRRIVLIVMPAGLAAYAAGHALETRQFYPLLAPFVAIHGGRGLWWLLRPARSDSVRVDGGRWALVALVAVVFLSPPMYVRLRDGPRVPLGRLPSPFLWRDWQDVVTKDRDAIERLVDLAGRTEVTTVVTTFFNTDHYLRLSLWQRGYRPHYSSEVYPLCKGGFEAWMSPARTIHRLLHVRMENPHLLQRPIAYVEAIQLQRALQCPQLINTTPVQVIGIGRQSADARSDPMWTLLHPKEGRDETVFGWHPNFVARIGRRLGGINSGWLERAVLSTQRVEVLTAADLSELQNETARVVTAYRREGLVDGYEQVMSRYAPRVAWPQYENGKAVWLDVDRETSLESGTSPTN